MKWIPWSGNTKCLQTSICVFSLPLALEQNQMFEYMYAVTRGRGMNVLSYVSVRLISGWLQTIHTWLHTYERKNIEININVLDNFLDKSIQLWYCTTDVTNTLFSFFFVIIFSISKTLFSTSSVIYLINQFLPILWSILYIDKNQWCNNYQICLQKKQKKKKKPLNQYDNLSVNGLEVRLVMKSIMIIIVIEHWYVHIWKSH
jgi:hypothetical protein